MAFENRPIGFDEEGNPYLRGADGFRVDEPSGSTLDDIVPNGAG